MPQLSTIPQKSTAATGTDRVTLVEGVYVPASEIAGLGTGAANITFNNTASGLDATDVQAALDEIAAGGGGGGGGVSSVNGQTGVVVLDADDVGAVPASAMGDTGEDLLAAATPGAARSILGLGSAAQQASTAFATAAQGALADSATQPGDLAAVATSGAVGDLEGFPGGTTNFLREDGTFAAPPGGGGGTPAGTTKQIQYNNDGAFGAESGFEYDPATNTLSVSNITLAGLLLTAASATGGAGLRLPHGAAPTSPVDGDVWTTTAGMFVRVNGTTVGPLAIAGSGGTGDVVGPATATADAVALFNGTTGKLLKNGVTIATIRSIPQSSKSANYTLVLADAGGHIFHPAADTTARTMTIPANSSVAFPIGSALTFVNQNGAGILTIAITTDTMRLAGSGATGSRTLAANGIATALKVTATEWIISGTGLA